MDNNTINRALELNETVSKLREENASLKRENRRQMEREQEILEEMETQEEALVASEAETQRLKEELKQLKVSLDCVFNDLEESKKVIAKQKQELAAKISETQPPNRINTPPKEESQANFLTSAVEKTSQGNSGFFSGFGVANTALERKIYSLEMENTKLKSDLVRLQARYREEAYLNRKSMEALQESFTAVVISPENSQIFHELNGNDSSTDDDDDDDHDGPEGLQTLSRVKKSFNKRGLDPENRNHDVSSSVSSVQQSRPIETHRPTADGAQVGLSSPLPSSPRRISSFWPDNKASNDISAPTVRRIQSYQPPTQQAQTNPEEDNQKDSPGGNMLLFGRSQSIRKIGWW